MWEGPHPDSGARGRHRALKVVPVSKYVMTKLIARWSLGRWVGVRLGKSPSEIFP